MGSGNWLKHLLVRKIEGKLTPNTFARGTKVTLNIWMVWNLIGIQLYAHLSLTVLEWRCPFSSFPLEIYPCCYKLDNGNNVSHLTVHVSVIIKKLKRFFNQHSVVPENIHTHLKEGYWKFQGGGGEGEKAKIVSKLNKSINQKC